MGIQVAESGPGRVERVVSSVTKSADETSLNVSSGLKKEPEAARELRTPEVSRSLSTERGSESRAETGSSIGGLIRRGSTTLSVLWGVSSGFWTAAAITNLVAGNIPLALLDLGLAIGTGYMAYARSKERA